MFYIIAMGQTEFDDYAGVEIRCPRCSSEKVVVCEDSEGHFQVTLCQSCGYKKECWL